MYIELLDLKTYLGIDFELERDDAILENAIRYSKGWIDSVCLRTFEASTDSTRKFDAVRDVRDRFLTLDRDLCSITAVINGDGTTITPTQYLTFPFQETPYWALQLKASSGVRWTYISDPEAAITVTGKWAYSISAPDSIQVASLRLAAYIYRIKDAQVFDVTAMSEVGAVKIDKRMPKDVLELLVPYRRAVAQS